MVRWATRPSLARMVGCHWTMCSCRRGQKMYNARGGSTHQRMRLGLLKVVAAVERVEPRLEEEAGPLAVLEHPAARRQAVLVLREEELDVAAAEMAKSLNDAIGRHDGIVLNHPLVQLGRVHNVGLDGAFGVHDERILVQEPQVLAVGELCQDVPRRHHARPA